MPAWAHPPSRADNIDKAPRPARPLAGCGRILHCSAIIIIIAGLLPVRRWQDRQPLGCADQNKTPGDKAPGVLFCASILKRKDRPFYDSRSSPNACTALALSNNRRRRGFALADVNRVVSLCEGRDAEESHRRCRQYSEYFHGTPPFVMTQEKPTELRCHKR